MAYPREEQETTLVFEAETGTWNVYSTVPKHMRKLRQLSEVSVLEFEADGMTPKAVRAQLTEKQVSMKKERVISEEQRQKMSERAKANLRFPNTD